MDSHDQFQGELPPTPDELNHRSHKRSQDLTRQRTPHNQEHSSQRRKKKRPVVTEIGDKLGGTFTEMQENPNYEQFRPKRRTSEEPTGAFTVQRGDSQINLIPGSEMAERATEASSHLANPGSPSKPKVVTMKLETTLETPDHEESYGHYNEDAIAEFIHESDIQMRQCKKYIKTKNPRATDATNCACGREYSWHEEMRIPYSKTQEKWSVEKHTETVTTNCFGTIHFQGFGQEASKNAPFIRIDQNTKPDIIWELMECYWKMPKPKLIISVTGGAKRFFLKSRLRNNFKRGLVNVATTTGAWIVTGGTNAGVMEFVGEAVRDYSLSSGTAEQKVVALGIATWGIIDNMDNLMPSEKETSEARPNGQFPAYYNCKDLSSRTVRGISPLDPNHTHFILVDNGQEKKFGAEISFRAAMENHIAHMETEVARNQRVTVPVVLLVLEGGENTIKTAMKAVEENTPVVIIQGSGRAADVIAFTVKYFKNNTSKGDEGVKFAPDKVEDSAPMPKAYEDIREKVEEWLDWSREEDVEAKKKKIFGCVKNIETMMQKRNLLTVFFLDDIDTTNEIDQAILYALLKAKKSEFLQQLKLALAWNRCDIARQEIFKNENRLQWQDYHMMQALYEAMFTAMVQNRVDFVQLFLDNGVELKEFLNVRRLRELYDEVVNDPRSGTCSSLLRHLLQREQSNWRACCCGHESWRDDLPNLLALVGQLINNLAGDQYQKLYQDKRYIVCDEGHESKVQTKENDFGMYTMSGTLGSATARSISRKRSRQPKINPDFEHPEKDLLFWAVLLNRKELALLFWKSGKDHIGGALTASSIFKALSNAASLEEELDLSNELMFNSDEFEDLATGVLNECYQRDKHTAHKLLTRSLDTWGGTTVFSMADTAEHMTLMGHSCCQTKLNKIWKGKMALYTAVWKIVVGLIFFPFIVPTIRFTTNDADDFSNQGHNNQVIPTTNEPYHPSGGKTPKKSNTTTTLYKVDAGGCCGSDGSVNMCNAYYLFHTAPFVKFCYHTLSYVVFLCLFCFFMLTNMRHPNDGGPIWAEYLVWGWAATMLLEEFRQIATRDPNSMRYKLYNYFSSVWNRFDMFVYLTLIVTIILRFTLPYNQFVWARRLYAITLTLFFLRFMQTYYVEKNMGPKVIMIKKMLTDLVFFVLILAVFVFGYGVAAQALRYPNAELSWNILRNVVYMPYWHIYGELFLDEMQGDTSASCPVADVNNPSCPQDSWLVMILLALYMIFTNVLLLNLLIAMFSYTFERVQANSEKVWRFHRYGLIYEYFDKPTLAPPLIILSHIYRFVQFLRRCCKTESKHGIIKRVGQKVDNDFYEELSKKENNKLTAFERVGMDNFLLHKSLLSREHIDAKVASTGDRIEKVIEDLEQIKETVASPVDAVPLIPSTEATGMPSSRSITVDQQENISVLKSHITGLQDQLDEQHHQMCDMHAMMEKLTVTMAGITHIQPPATLPAAPTHNVPMAPTQSHWDVPVQLIPNVGTQPTQGRLLMQLPQQDSQFSHRIKKGPHPQIEIQDFPPGYTDT